MEQRKGVVLATGGYAHNKHFRDAFMPQPVPVHSMSCEGNLGDGMEIGQRLGAATAPAQSTSGLWAPVSIVPRPDGSKGLFPHLVLDRAKPGLIAVNSAGRRFVNEAASYHDFVLAMFESHQTTPTIPAWLICDAAFLGKYGLGVIYPGHRNPGKFVDSGYITLAQTLEPDVVILDLVMPVLDGINAGRQLQQVTPGARLILLTVYTTADAVFAAVHSGFLGCVAKSDAVEDLGRAIREVLLGRIFLSRKPASAVLALLFGEPDIQSRGAHRDLH